MSATDLRARALSGEWRSRMNMRLLLAHSSMCSSSRASPLRARRRQNRRLVSPDTAAPCSVLGGGDPLVARLPVMRSSTFQCGASPLRARGRRPPSLVPPSQWLQRSFWRGARQKIRIVGESFSNHIPIRIAVRIKLGPISSGSL
jgi:hypothetical protein